jgi:hypothetical protein
MLYCGIVLHVTDLHFLHMQTCVKILKFTFFFILKLFFTSLVHYIFRPVWSSSGAPEIAVENYCTSGNEYNFKVYPRLCAHVLYMILLTCHVQLFHYTQQESPRTTNVQQQQ